jgi:hypothetical protein
METQQQGLFKYSFTFDIIVTTGFLQTKCEDHKSAIAFPFRVCASTTSTGLKTGRRIDTKKTLLAKSMNSGGAGRFQGFNLLKMDHKMVVVFAE